MQLACVAKTAFHALDIADGGGVGFGVIYQHQPQARGAVGGAGDILFAAEQRQERAGNLFKIHNNLSLVVFYVVSNTQAPARQGPFYQNQVSICTPKFHSPPAVKPVLPKASLLA